MVAREENNGVLSNNWKDTFMYTGVFKMCVWELAKARSSLWNKRHSVMKCIWNIIWFSTLSVFTWDKQPLLPPNRKRWLTVLDSPSFHSWLWKCHSGQKQPHGHVGQFGDRRVAQGEKWYNTIWEQSPTAWFKWAQQGQVVNTQQAYTLFFQGLNARI